MSEETVIEEGKGKVADETKQPSAEELAALKAEAAQRRIKANELQAELDAIKAKQAAAEEEAAKKRGEFEQLYSTEKANAEQFKTQAERAESALAKFLETEMAGIPEDKQALIPDGDSASKLEWIGKAKAAGLFTIAKGGATPPETRLPGGTKQTTSLQEQLDEAIKNRQSQKIIALKRQIFEAENN